MSSKSQRKNAAKRRRRLNRPVDLWSVDQDDLPRPILQMLQASEEFERYLSSAQDLDDAAAQALTEACEAAQRLAALAEKFDAFDVLEIVRLSQLTANPETYKETEHEGSAAVVELVASILACRGRRTGTAPDEGGHRADAGPAIDPVLTECTQIVAAGSTFVALKAMAGSATAGSIALGAVLREVFVRNLAYPHMVEDTLDGLFRDPLIEADCRTAMGCSVDEIRSVFSALTDLHQAGWARRHELLGDAFELARSEMAKAQSEDATDEPTIESTAAPESMSSDARREARALWTSAWADPADSATLTPQAVADAAGLTPQVVATVVDLFATDMAVRDPAEATQDLLDGRSPFRTRPILRDPGGAFVVVHGGLLVPAIRERVEDALKAANVWDRYAKHRGADLERETLCLLQAQLPRGIAYESVEYFVPNPAVAVPETTPAAYTKRVEGDGLLVVDDIAIIVEAKAGSLSPLSRTGDLKRLDQDLRKIVTGAAA